MIYFITINYNSAALIAKLLASIVNQAGNYCLIIVNNSPHDRELPKLKHENVVILEANTNLGFGGGCNLGLEWVYERDTKAIVWLINPDTTVPDGAVATAIALCNRHPEHSIVGTVVNQPDGKVWFGGGEFDPKNGRIVASQNLPTADFVPTVWVTGCSMLLNLQNFSTCPRFDAAYFLYYEDFDFCRRYAAQGHTIVITRQIWITHQPSLITSRQPALKLQYSTYSYLLALEKHTNRRVLLYRLGRILFHALRVVVMEPEKAIAIIKGVSNYVVQVSHFDQSINH